MNLGSTSQVFTKGSISQGCRVGKFSTQNWKFPPCLLSSNWCYTQFPYSLMSKCGYLVHCQSCIWCGWRIWYIYIYLYFKTAKLIKKNISYKKNFIKKITKWSIAISNIPDGCIQRPEQSLNKSKIISHLLWQENVFFLVRKFHFQKRPTSTGSKTWFKCTERLE